MARRLQDRRLQKRRLQKYNGTGIVTMMLLMLCAVVPSDSRSPVAEAVSGGPELRLAYVFNPEVDEHLERALQVQSLVRSAPSQISVLG